MGVYKRKNSPHWWIRYSGLDGKVVRKSVRTDDLEKAKSELQAIKDSILLKKQEFVGLGLEPEICKWCSKRRSEIKNKDLLKLAISDRLESECLAENYINRIIRNAVKRKTEEIKLKRLISKVKKQMVSK